MIAAAMGGAYEFTRIASANLRQSNDTYNEAIGGFFGGAMLGLRCTPSNPHPMGAILTNTAPVRSIPAVLGYGAALSVVMTAFQFSGGSLFGAKDQSVDEYERKEALRRNRRRPIQETLEELGEGRGTSLYPRIHDLKIDMDRRLRPWIRRATSTAHQGEVRH